MTESRIRVSELCVAALLVLATLLSGIWAGRVGVFQPLVQHGALLIGFGAVLWWRARGRGPSWLSTAATIAVIFILYGSLGQLGFDLRNDSGFDQQLATADHYLFGGSPSLALQGMITPWLTEFLSAVYLAFFVYVYASIARYMLTRDPRQRERFLLGLTVSYCLGYLGYLMFPAHGPLVFHASEYTSALGSGPVFAAMMAVVAKAGGAVGAFPSLHVGAAVFLLLFDAKTSPQRAFRYAPFVVLVGISTVYLRFHYVVDWFGGIAVALCGLWIAQRVFPQQTAASRTANVIRSPGIVS